MNRLPFISFESLMKVFWGWHTQFPTSNHETSLIAALSFIILHIMCIVWFCRRIYTSCFKSSSKQVDDDTKLSTNKTQYIISIILLLISIELPVLLTTTNEGLADLIKGTDSKLNEILQRVPLIKIGPKPPLLLRNRHIQFIPWMIQNLLHQKGGGIPYQRIAVEVSDCINKDIECLNSNLHEHQAMNDTILLDIFPPFDDDSPYSKGFNKASPVILFQPGLRCRSQDLPGNSIIRKAYEFGFRSIVVNRRGLIQLLKVPRMNIFGDVDDLEQIYNYIKRELVSNDTPFFLYGISAGTSMTVTALSKWDRRRIDEPESNPPVIVASVDVVPGYDISTVLKRERFLWPYNDLLLQGVKDHFVLQNEEVLRKYNSDAVDKMLAASSLQEVVDEGVVFAGYTNTSSYYGSINPINKLEDITTPKLVLNSADDPCCNIQNLYEISPYDMHDGQTFADMIRGTKRGMVAVARSGSHAPFLCNRNNRWLVFDALTGGYMINSWSDQVAIEYFQAALEVYGDRRYL